TLSNGSATLRLAPQVADRDHHHLQRRGDRGTPAAALDGDTCTVELDPIAGTLWLRCPNARWETAGWWNENLFLEREAARGFDCVEDWFCPATATAGLKAGQPIRMVASLGSEIPAAEPSPRAVPVAMDPIDRLRRAAERFVVETPRRTSVLAGYPWFADWGRDTCIALPGLLLSTGRFELARHILLDTAATLRSGRIPNRFPDIGDEPAYNNADATLWFVRACRSALSVDPEQTFSSALHDPIRSILEHHAQGSVGDDIGAAPDGLLRCGNPSTNLTWMDAKVHGVPVTPRDGKPVEIQALWIDALEFGGELLGEPRWKHLADAATNAFHRKFVREDGLGLFDRLDSADLPDPAIRPNQVVAAAVLGDRLPTKTLRNVLTVSERELLTPYGLRTLSPGDRHYQGVYAGGPEARDAAYHQGTVWPWLIGFHVDLARHVHGPTWDAGTVLGPLLASLDTFGIDGISEIHGSEPPYPADGCPWQAWSVAEVLRSLLRIAN
ncbi:MAG: amylo-alpha-1,6-glucosidase, partial [Armatimonadota bacterium]